MRELAARVRLLVEIVVRGSPRLALIGLLLFAARYAIVPLTAIGLRAVVDAATSGDTLRAALIALVVAALWVVELPIDAVMNREGLNLADMNRIALEGEMIELTQGSARVDHLEAPEFADYLETVQALSGDIFWAYGGVVGTVVLAVQFVVVCLLLGSVSPILILLIVLSLAPIACGQLAERIVGRARDASAQASRQRRHLLDTAANPAAAKEIRVFALADELRQRRNQADREASDILDRAHVRAGLLRGLGETIFGLGFAGALYVVVNAGIHHTASVGDAVLTVSLAVSVSAQLVYVVGGLDRLQLALNQTGALLWLRRSVAASDSAAGTLQPPDVLRDGIVLEDVSFQYPAANDAALRGMSVRLPAGRVIALVGENGAGKSTLIKLLAGLHRPDSGRILVEGVALDDIDLRRWRERMTGAFQDFARLETLAGETVGLGDHPRKDEEAAVRTALERASADDLHTVLPDGLRTQLGRSYADGTELSGGQWQKLALARGMMADAPLLLFLDEPTAALDPHAEHLLFESYAERAKVAGRELGAITILVSHRFSTVRMADLVLVIENGRVAESGTHAELMSHRGHYATVYELQANAYK